MSDRLPIRKVSIITVLYNNYFHTKRFLESLDRWTPQEPIEWELIVIDNGSTDQTRDWLHSAACPKFKGQVVHLEENVGWIKGVNLGIQRVSPDTDIIVWANNDVVLDKRGWLERLCAHFTETIGAVGPTSNYVIGRQGHQFNHAGITEEPTNLLIGFFFAVRKSVVDQIGLLDENLGPLVNGVRLGGGDDFDYSIRIRNAGYQLMIARDVFVWHSGSKTFFEVIGQDGYNQHWRACDKAVEEKWGADTVRNLFTAPLSVAFGIPLRDWFTHWKFSRSLMFMQRPFLWNLIDAPRAVVDQARDQIAAKARECHNDYVLFLDDDHVVPADLFPRLYGYQKDVVGVAAFRRVYPFSPCVFDWITEPKNGNLAVVERPDLIQTGLQKVDAVGFGAVLIKTSVFDKLGPQPWFRFSEVGEDLHFCDLCRKNGIEIYCDTDLVLPHINSDGWEITEQTYFDHNVANAAILGYEKINGTWTRKQVPPNFQTRVQVA